MKRALFFVLALCLSTPALAQMKISGPASVVDGDTLRMTGSRIRLHGIDAPEASQTCDRSGEVWACGRDATDLLTEIVGAKQITCEQRDTDSYGRIVATCKAGALDLAGVMVSAGLAVALPKFSEAYVEAEAQARARQIGIWGSAFQLPAEYRATQPAPAQTEDWKSEPAVGAAPTRSRTSLQDRQIWFRNCNEARAAGAAPLYRGQPGYRPQMDGDGDGIACEPYRGRR